MVVADVVAILTRLVGGLGWVDLLESDMTLRGRFWVSETFCYSERYDLSPIEDFSTCRCGRAWV